MTRHFQKCAAVCIGLLEVAMSIESASCAIDRHQSVMTTGIETPTSVDHPVKTPLGHQATPPRQQQRGDFERIGTPTA
jgi:hypothetical protein